VRRDSMLWIYTRRVVQMVAVAGGEIDLVKNSYNPPCEVGRARAACGDEGAGPPLPMTSRGTLVVFTSHDEGGPNE
jgi:hypothetical protein